MTGIFQDSGPKTMYFIEGLTMSNVQPDNDSQIIDLIRSYLRYRMVDATFGTDRGKKALETLERLGMTRVYQVSEGLLTSDDSDLRCCGAEMLMRIDRFRALPLLLQLLQDKESGVRWFICGIVHDFGDIRALPDITQLLRSDPAEEVRLLAAHTLRRIGDLDEIATLLWTTQHDTGTDWEGRSIAFGALEAILDILMNVFQDELTAECYLPLTQQTSTFSFADLPVEGAFAHTFSRPKARLHTATVYQPRIDTRQRCCISADFVYEECTIRRHFQYIQTNNEYILEHIHQELNPYNITDTKLYRHTKSL